ncbi:MAG: PAS domain S-box protein [Candidatus Cloacimonetes bacterium]|nr:PAS domain S-box protein [Candidatus Cloacimonadota bacterium]
MKRKILLASILLFALSLLFSEQLVRVGVYENSPKIYTDENGVPSGFWIDLIEYIATQENWTLQYVHGSWNHCIEWLENSEIDILPDVALTSEREKRLTFSEEPVLLSWSGVYINKDTKLKSLLDLEGKRVGGLIRSSNFEDKNGFEDILKSYAIKSELVEYNSYDEVFMALKKKQIFAGITNKDYGLMNERRYRVKSTPIVFSPSTLMFAFPQSGVMTPLLKKRIDYHVITLRKDLKSIYYKSLDKYMGSITPERRIPKWIYSLLILVLALVLFIFMLDRYLKAQIRSKVLLLEKQYTKQLETENELIEYSRRWQTTFDAMSDSVVLLDPDSNIIQVNKATTELFGYTSDRLLGKKCFEIVHGLNGPFENCPNLRMQKSLKKETMEFKFGDKWYLVSVTPILDSESKLTGAVHVMSDITAVKENEIMLSEKTNFLNTIIENAAVSMWISDEKGYAVSTNQACLKLFGASEEEVIGKYTIFNDNIIKEKGLMPLVEDVFNNGVIADFEMDYDFKAVDHVTVQNATHKYIRSIITPVINKEGFVTNAIIQTVDLTDIKLAEIQLEKHGERLEELVKERTKELETKNTELERFNKLFVGREFRIKELKDRVAALEGRVKG